MILLVPQKYETKGYTRLETYNRLLATGPFDARPPLVYSGQSCGYREHRLWKERDYYHSDCYMCGEDGDQALVLAADGAPVKDGVLRAASVLAVHEGLDALSGVLWHRSHRGHMELHAVGRKGEGVPRLIEIAYFGGDGPDERRPTFPWASHVPGFMRAPGRQACGEPVPPVSDALFDAWALAFVCAGRGLGSVVVLP